MTPEKPCDQCPWRLTNQGKKHKLGFYTKSNLRRLWNQIRGGGRAQSCHLTDPSHPDHVAVGAKPGATARECPGSVIIVLRELERMKNSDGVIDTSQVEHYFLTRKRGLTKRGILYWIMQRVKLANVKLMNVDGPLPSVNINDKAIGLPRFLREE
jgi:hypothetical protein